MLLTMNTKTNACAEPVTGIRSYPVNADMFRPASCQAAMIQADRLPAWSRPKVLRDNLKCRFNIASDCSFLILLVATVRVLFLLPCLSSSFCFKRVAKRDEQAPRTGYTQKRNDSFYKSGYPSIDPKMLRKNGLHPTPKKYTSSWESPKYVQVIILRAPRLLQSSTPCPRSADLWIISPPPLYATYPIYP